MLNTQSLRRTFGGFCENNNLSTLLNKYMETDGTMKPQYVTGDNGVEHDHKVAMALHKWNKGTEHNAVYNGQSITMRVGTPVDNTTDVQLETETTFRSSRHYTVNNVYADISDNDYVLTSFVP
eukprot:2500381-Amphidinium_carterae.1